MRRTRYLFLGRYTGQEISFVHEVDEHTAQHRVVAERSRQTGPWLPLSQFLTYQLGDRQWVFQMNWINMPTAFELVMPEGFKPETMNPTEGTVG